MTESEPFSLYVIHSYYWGIDAYILYRGLIYRELNRVSPSDANRIIELLNAAFLHGRAQGVIETTTDLNERRNVQQSVDKFMKQLKRPRGIEWVLML